MEVEIMTNSKQRFGDVLRHPNRQTIEQLRRVARQLYRGGWLDEARSLAKTADTLQLSRRAELREKP